MGLTDKLPLINSTSRVTKIIGYVLYAFVILMVLGAILPHNTENVTETSSSASTTPTTAADVNSSASTSEPPSNAVLHNSGFGNYTFDSQDKVRANVRKATDIIHMMGTNELIDNVGYTSDRAQYTITTTGTSFKGYIDYTNDGYAVVMQPKTHSLTKGDFEDILSTFHRTD